MSTAKQMQPWQAALLPVPAFPLEGEELRKKTAFFDLLSEKMLGRGLHQHLYLQAWKLSPTTGAGLVSQNAAKWRPTLGLGIWPNQPPTGWTETSFSDAVAAQLSGNEPRMPSHQLLRLNAGPRELTLAASQLRGSGTTLTVFSTLQADELEARAQTAYQPILNDTARRARFLFPVLDGALVKSARSGAELDRWLCGAEMYIRESAEDKGFLIVSRLPLDPILSEVRQALASNHGRPLATKAGRGASGL